MNSIAWNNNPFVYSNVLLSLVNKELSNRWLGRISVAERTLGRRRVESEEPRENIDEVGAEQY